MIVGYVVGQALTIDTPVIASDSVNYIEARFVFLNRDWDGLAIHAIFDDGDVAYACPLKDGRVAQDNGLNLGAGTWRVHLVGSAMDGDVLVRRITTNPAKIEVVCAGRMDGEPVPPARYTDIEEIEAALTKKIDAPQVAQVGEVLTVEEVGEDGKPIKWKTAPGVNITTELTQESTDSQVPSAKAAYDAIQNATDKDAVRFVAQELTNAQKQQARENIDAINSTYYKVNGFNDILNSIEHGFGVCTGLGGHGSAPKDMKLPVIFIYGDGNRGIYDLTMYDSNGKVWVTENRYGTSFGTFTVTSHNSLIVNVSYNEDTSSLSSDIHAIEIYQAVQKGIPVIALAKITNRVVLFQLTESKIEDEYYKNTFTNIMISQVSISGGYKIDIFGNESMEDTVYLSEFALVTGNEMEYFANAFNERLDKTLIYITITKTQGADGDQYTANKTFDEILSVIEAGGLAICNYPAESSIYGPKNIICLYNERFVPPHGADYLIFTQTTDGYGYVCCIDMNNNVTCYYNIRDTTPKLPTPTTAQVGQIVKVKAVDADGKITETEAVDIPTQKTLKWITVHSSDLTETKRELIISTDTDGKSIVDYNPVGLSLIVSTPADATVESNNGAPWIYPSTTNFDNAIRVIGSISGWKTIARDSAFVFNGGSSAMSCSGNVNTSLPTYKLDGYALDGVRIFFNSANDHLPVGTHVEVAILCEVAE